MVQIRASQVFTHSIEDAVAAKKALDADEPFNEVVEKYSTCPVSYTHLTLPTICSV